MALLKGNDDKQLRQLVKACLLEISKLKIDLKKCQKESSRSGNENTSLNEIKEDTQNKLLEKDKKLNTLQDLLNEKNEKMKELEEESSRSSNESISANEIKENTQNKLLEKDKEINALQDLLNRKNEKLEKLENIKYHFDALTAKPKKDLTSFQSQVYQLLPKEEGTLEDLYAHITEIGFSELTGENFEHVLHNLERKDYFHSSNRNNKTYWKKIDK